MPLVPLRRTIGAALAAAMLSSGSPHADAKPTRRDADLMKQKVIAIVQLGARGSIASAGRQARRTMVTENEVNAYLTFDAREDLPSGVVDPSVTILGEGRVAGRAVVDLDAVRKEANATSLFDPLSYLGGRLPITATGTLRTSRGVGRFELTSAAVGGVPVPKMLLQQIVSYYSRTPDNPAGIGLDDPFALPAGIREIQVERGQAVILQ